MDYLNGDPDRPLITNRVYNNLQPHPWGLPANATQSGFLTRSTPNGTVDDANAFRFEDKIGAEQIWIYKQLKAQEDGINKMTVGEYTANRNILKDLTKKHGHKKAREILTDGGKAQEAARNKLSQEINDFILDSLERKDIVGKEAQKIATDQTQKQMTQLAALHDPDLIAGGYDAHTKDKFEISRVGNKNVNSSLGSQWAKDGRVDEMDKAAGKAMTESGPETPMNVKLEQCKE